MIHVTDHAVARWIERVDPRADKSRAIAAIMSHQPAILSAAAFGANTVKLGCGNRLVIDGTCVITVLARWQGLNRGRGVGDA